MFTSWKVKHGRFFYEPIYNLCKSLVIVVGHRRWFDIFICVVAFLYFCHFQGLKRFFMVGFSSGSI